MFQIFVRLYISCFFNPKYLGGIEAQKAKLEAEGYTIIQRGRTNIKYFVKDYQNTLYDLS